MKKIWMLAVAGSLVFLAAPGCGKGGGKERSASQAMAKASVTVNELKKPVKTAKGTPVRVFEVTPAGAGGGSAETGGSAPKSNKSLVAIVGDPSASVEIPDASAALVGGRKVPINLTMVGPTLVLISAANLDKGSIVPGITVEAAEKQIATGTLDVPGVE